MLRHGSRLYGRLSLRTQLFLITSMLSLIASLIVGVSSYALQERALRAQAGEQMASRGRQTALNIENLLENLNNTLMMLASDARVQNYLLLSDETAPESIAMLDEVYSLLVYTNSLPYNLSYSYILKARTDRVIYLGPSRAQQDLQFERAWEAVQENGTPGRRHIEGPFVNPVSGDGAYAFAFYQAIHDIYQVRTRLGVLCLALPESRIASEFSASADDPDHAFCVIGPDGTIISHGDSARIGERDARFAALGEGVATYEDALYVRIAIPGTDWAVVGSMPLTVAPADRGALLLLVAGMVTLTIALCTLVSALAVKAFTRPFETLRRHMERISRGDLTGTMELSQYGREYGLIAQGFNTMSMRIGVLMEEARAASAALKDSELRALKAQINPHFLYNTLDSIHWLAAMNGQKEISTMVMALANFYRVCLGNAREMIPLGEEIRHVTSYLTIQRIRYSDVLQSEIDVRDVDLSLHVPSMILQPLVENAIYHGLKGQRHLGTVRIAVYRDGDLLRMDVTDDGRGMTDEELAGVNRDLAARAQAVQGHGVLNVHRRILLLCGEDYGLAFEARAGGGVVARMRLPVVKGEGTEAGEGEA